MTSRMDMPGSMGPKKLLRQYAMAPNELANPNMIIAPPKANPFSRLMKFSNFWICKSMGRNPLAMPKIVVCRKNNGLQAEDHH